MGWTHERSRSTFRDTCGTALRRGSRWPGTYLIRTGLLFLDGMLNYIFVVQIDVLRAYAILTLMLMPLFTAAVHLHAPGDRVPGRRGRFERAVGVLGDGAGERPDGVLRSHDRHRHRIHHDSRASALPARRDPVSPRAVRTARGTPAQVGHDHRTRHRLPLELTFFLAQDQFGLDRFLSAPFVAFGILALMAAFYQRHPIGFVGRQLPRRTDGVELLRAAERPRESRAAADRSLGFRFLTRRRSCPVTLIL